MLRWSNDEYQFYLGSILIDKKIIWFIFPFYDNYDSNNNYLKLHFLVIWHCKIFIKPIKLISKRIMLNMEIVLIIYKKLKEHYN